MDAIQHELIRELAGVKCFCGANKVAAQTFCGKHYFGLPQQLRRALYRRVGAGYEEAYKAAREFIELSDNTRRQLRERKAAAAPFFN